MCVSSSFVFSCSLFLLFIDYEVYVLLSMNSTLSTLSPKLTLTSS